MNGSEENKLTPSNSQFQGIKVGNIRKILIDKIRFTGDFNLGYIDKILMYDDPNLDFNHDEDFTRFWGFYESSNGERVNFEFNQPKATATKSRNTWVEWNPNKFPTDELQPLQDVLFKFMNNTHITRVDLAFDINRDLSNYRIYKNTPLKQRIFYGQRSEIETMYIGSPVSDNHIKIYNKKLQLETEENTYIDLEHLWRFEITLKSKKIYDLHNSLNKVNFYLPNYEMVENIQEKAMLYFLEDHPNHWHTLSKNTRTKYRKLQRETQDFVISDILREKLVNESDLLVNKINNFLEMFNNAKKISLKPTKLK